MKFYKKLKNLFLGKKKTDGKLLNYLGNEWNEFFGSIYDSFYHLYYSADRFFDWRNCGEIYRQKIIQNMSPILVRNNFDVYFTKTGFVFERGLEKHL